MKKFGFICLFLAVILGGGWIVHTYYDSHTKTNNLGAINFIIEGNNFLNIGRYDEAKRLFLQALSIEPKNVDAAWGLKKTEAKEFSTLAGFKQATDLLYQQNPSDAHINLFLGEFYLANHEFDKSSPYFEQAITQNQKLAEAYFDLASIYEQQGNFDRARSELLIAIDIVPTPKYRNKLAHVYLKQKHIDAAIAEYEKTSEYPLSALDVAKVYWRRDRLDLALIRQLQAVKWLDNKTVIAKPENQDPWFFAISEEQTLTLNKLEEKKSYAYLCLAFTLYLLENTEEAGHYIQQIPQLTAARQTVVNTIVSADLDALVQEKASLATQVDAFKKLYLVEKQEEPIN